MEAEISGLIASQERVHNLLNIVSTKRTDAAKSLKDDVDRTILLAAEDKAFRHFRCKEIMVDKGRTKSTPELLLAAKKYSALHPLAFSSHTKRLEYKSFLLNFSPTFYPKQVKQCPSVEEIKTRLAEEQIIITVHSYDGYDFSAEYTSVYKGKFTKNSAFEDLIVVLKRTIRSLNPAANDLNCTKYADFIARMAPWEGDLAGLVWQETLRGLFPEWKADPLEIGSNANTTSGSSLTFRHIQVYIGYDVDGELSFNVRSSFALEMQLRSPASSTNGSKTARAAAAETITNSLDIDIGEDTSLECVYYRKFALNDATIATFIPVSFLGSNVPKTGTSTTTAAAPGTMQPPPPPPRRAKPNKSLGADDEDDDIRLFLLVHHKEEGDLEITGADPEEAVSSAENASGAPSSPTARDAHRDDDNQDSKGIGSTVPSAEYESIYQNPLAKTPSFNGELFGWGFDGSQSLGLGPRHKKAGKAAGLAKEGANEGTNKEAAEKDANGSIIPEGEQGWDMVYSPRSIPLDGIIAVERVKMLACSSNHTLLLTCMGSVFACGENAEGALGFGDFAPRSSFCMVDLSSMAPKHGQHTTGRAPEASSSAAVVIKKVAAGSSSIGSHSMAIDRGGELYGWGVAYAVGAGVVKAINEPTRIQVVTDEEISINVNIDAAINDDHDNDDDDASEAMAFARAEAAKIAAAEKEVVDVACGGGFTVCVTRAGHVYSWGVWAHGRLGLGPIPMQEAIKGPYRRAAKKTARYQLFPRRILGIEGAVQVDCGEAHALCLLQSGSVLGWGQNSCGQVGNGPDADGYLKDMYRPVLLPQFGSGADVIESAHAFAKFIVTRNKIRATSLDKKNCDMGIGRFFSKTGNHIYQEELRDWSHRASSNPRGSIRGTTDTISKSGAEDEAAATLPPGAYPKGRIVCCGAFHSLCVDRRGVVYTWGARGSPCLGHHDAPVVGDWNNRINAIFSISTAENKTMVPFELYRWCMTWSMPRSVKMLAGGPSTQGDGSIAGDAFPGDDTSVSTIGNQTIHSTRGSEFGSTSLQRVVQVVAGDLYSGFLTRQGKFFLCGSGPAVPNFMPASRMLFDIDPQLSAKAREKELLDRAMQEEELKRMASVVACPRCPSDAWLREICTRRATSIFGAGNRIFTVLDEEAVSPSLTSPLLDTLLSTVSAADESPAVASGSGSSAASLTNSHIDSLFENRGKADCMVLASGKVFLCHKALLSQRSPELRNMIFMESPTTGDDPNQLVQILLPELQRDAARALLHYLYRDVLPPWSISNISLLTSLARTSQKLRMPRLQLLCTRFLRLLRHGGSQDDVGTAAAAADDVTLMDVPPPTLARDLSAMVGDPEFADVRFIAEGRAVVGHRFILEARCPYFRAMFRSGMAEGGGGGLASSASSVASGQNNSSGGIVDVVVPDTFVGFLRLLIFIYTGTLPDGSDGALLEDLMAADRYVLPDMKLLCENMLIPSESNWLDLLRAAQLLNSSRLELQVMAFLKENFSVLQGLYHNNGRDISELDDDTQGEKSTGDSGETTSSNIHDDDDDDGNTIQYSNVADFQMEFPGLLEELLKARNQLFPLPPSQMLINQSQQSIKATNDSDALASQRVPVFPIWALVTAAVSFFLYQHVSRIVALGPVIPLINLAALAFTLYYAYGYFVQKKA